jgi:putative ABC transport system permease protein
MIKNYFKIALRNLTKNKGISFINITGLAIGIACSILILLFIQTELSYDLQHSKAANIFRVLTIDKALGVSSNLVGITLPALGPAMKNEFPEVKESVRINRSGKNLIEYNKNTIYTTDLIYAEPSLFSVFNFNLISGDKKTALTTPNTAVITRTIAGKIFGNENPIGKTFKLDNDNQIEVVGILDNIPQTSHLAMDVVISLLPTKQDTNLAQYLNSWGSISMTTYVLLNDPSNERTVEKKLEPLIRKNNVGKNFNVTLQPLKDVHLKSSDILFDDANQNKSDIGYIYSLFAVAVFIILIASFNFMNLSTARAGNRAREVGLRKVVGALRQQLVFQYLGESVLLCFISFFIALILVEIFIPLINLPFNESFVVYLMKNPWFIITLISATIILGILSGSYPALVLSGFKPIKVLKGSVKNSKGGVWLRRILVVVQFTASIGMIIGTYVVYQQLDYIRHKNMGYAREQVLAIDLNDQQVRQNSESLINELNKISTIEGTSLSSTLPGRGFGRTSIQPEGHTNDEEIWIVSIMASNENFIPNMKMEIVEGRNFSKEYPSDEKDGAVLNEAAAKAFGWKDPLGKKLSFGPNSQLELKVIGVVKDFHFASMRHSIEPLIIVNNPGFYKNILSVRLKTEKISSSINTIKNVWQKINPSHPFEYSFLDDEFEQLYKTERSFSNLISSFAVLAIFIACLGLFGLASFITEQRTKEIGIRKVLGASISNILLITTKQFIILVIIANLIAWPIAYYFMNNWLSDFAYRVELGWFTFVLAAISTILIAVLTVLYQSVKAAVSNPVKSLRYE